MKERTNIMKTIKNTSHIILASPHIKAALITKHDTQNDRKYQCIIYMEQNENNSNIIILNPNYRNRILVSLCKKYSGEDHIIRSIEKFYYLIGKMCSNDIDSKYFASPILEEDRKNGDGSLFTSDEMDEIVDKACQ